MNKYSFEKFSMPSVTPIECLCLEIGAVPLRFHIMSLHIMYLWSILQRGNEEVTKRVVLCQKEGDFYRGGFYTQTKANMEYRWNVYKWKKKPWEDTDERPTHEEKKSFWIFNDKRMKHSKVNCAAFSNSTST